MDQSHTLEPASEALILRLILRNRLLIFNYYLFKDILGDAPYCWHHFQAAFFNVKVQKKRPLSSSSIHSYLKHIHCGLVSVHIHKMIVRAFANMYPAFLLFLKNNWLFYFQTLAGNISFKVILSYL